MGDRVNLHCFLNAAMRWMQRLGETHETCWEELRFEIVNGVVDNKTVDA